MTYEGFFYVFVAVLLAGGTCGPIVPCHAQNNRFTQRAFVPSPTVLGMGDAGVALSGSEHGFFYNPAHLPAASSHFTIFGLQGASTRSLDNQISFLRNRVGPAIQSDSNRSQSAPVDLRRDATDLGRRPGRGAGSLLLPSFVYSAGSVGVGGGIFAKTALNYRAQNQSAGGPSVWLLSRTDVMALASVGLDLEVIGLSDISVGLTGTETRRLLAFERKPLDRLGTEETAVFLEGNVFQMDVGLSYEPGWWTPVPGTLRFAGAVYDVLGADYAYTSGGDGRMPFLNEVVGPPTDSTTGPSAVEIERARKLFSLKSSYRIGVGYEIPALFFLDDVAVAVDYQGYRTDAGPTPLGNIHGGVRAEVIDDVHLRGGVSSGYPSGGLGVELGALYLDYSLHGVEAGRRPGQVGVYVHTARVLFRLE